MGCLLFNNDGRKVDSHRCRAFTLVELLVVISIIALLLSILMPSLSRARELAKRTVCSTNVRSLLQGVILYSQDYDSAMPIFFPPNGTSVQQGWDCAAREQMLYHGYIVSLGLLWRPTKYIENGHAFFCPSGKNTTSYEKQRITGGPFSEIDEINGTNITSSYYLRGDLTSHYPSENYSWPQAYAEFKIEKTLLKHTNRIIITDSGFFWDGYEATFTESISKRINHKTRDGRPAYFNNGWADGHVAGYTVKNPDERWPYPVGGTSYHTNATGMVRMEKGDW